MAKPLYIEAERLSGFKQRGADVDVVLDLMIHDLDLALSLVKAPVSQVSACGFRVLTEEIDIANARIEFADGCVASLSASRVSQAPVRKLRVFQTDVYVSANLQAGKLRYVRQAGGAIEETEEVHAGGDALSLQAAAFVAAVARQKPVEVSGEHRSEEHTSELQSRLHLVCRLLLEKKKKKKIKNKKCVDTTQNRSTMVVCTLNE